MPWGVPFYRPNRVANRKPPPCQAPNGVWEVSESTPAQGWRPPWEASTPSYVAAGKRSLHFYSGPRKKRGSVDEKPGELAPFAGSSRLFSPGAFLVPFGVYQKELTLR